MKVKLITGNDLDVPDDLTRVVFRMWNDGDVIALFPDIPATPDGRCCLSYAHLGQHCAAKYTPIIRATRPSTVEEAAPLCAELLRAGYRLKVVRRR
jgi:hypothetical protein